MRIPEAVYERAVARVLGRIVGEKAHRAVAAALGRRNKSQTWRRQKVVSVFVKRKLSDSELKEASIPQIPTSVTVRHASRTYRVPIDVVELGEDVAQFHSRNAYLGEGLKLEVGPTISGWTAWYVNHESDRYYALTAEHVVGFGSEGRDVFLKGFTGVGGRVMRCAYGLNGSDAALLELAADILPSNAAGFDTARELGSPRWVDITDTDSTKNDAHVLLDRKGWTRTKIRYVHMEGPILHSGGVPIKPRNLILTDLVTVRGDSGSLLVDKTGTAIGILSAGYGKYSLFTEITSAFDALLSP